MPDRLHLRESSMGIHALSYGGICFHDYHKRLCSLPELRTSLPAPPRLASLVIQVLHAFSKLPRVVLDGEDTSVKTFQWGPFSLRTYLIVKEDRNKQMKFHKGGELP